jgi:hypothetical protein
MESNVTGTKHVVLRPVEDGPIIALVDGITFVSDETGTLQRCRHLREALERSGWVYFGNNAMRH